jgi:hypothetical protein
MRFPFRVERRAVTEYRILFTSDADGAAEKKHRE